MTYVNLYITRERLGETEDDIKEAISRDKRRQQLLKEIAALEKKIKNEAQFNRQVELNGVLKWLMKELDSL